jgi:hypothetical protein
MRWRSVFAVGILALALFGIAAAGPFEDGQAALGSVEIHRELMMAAVR